MTASNFTVTRFQEFIPRHVEFEFELAVLNDCHCKLKDGCALIIYGDLDQGVDVSGAIF